MEGFQKLENCTVIEGKLHILLIDHAEQKDYEKFRFPLLREKTGHLLLYRVYGLKTLRYIFPNLAVIRGQDLFYNYALVAYEMPDLEEIGLVSLTTIMRGAVRLTKNRRLCYVDTIDWSRIALGLKESDHHIQENKDETKCVNYCPEDCTMTKVDGKEAKRCWTSNHCQKNLGEYWLCFYWGTYKIQDEEDLGYPGTTSVNPTLIRSTTTTTTLAGRPALPGKNPEGRL